MFALLLSNKNSSIDSFLHSVSTLLTDTMVLYHCYYYAIVLSESIIQSSLYLYLDC
ncbi:hypothetical protein BD560DRAFT_407158, partial [Blakeslea trispora]